ncbi:hypothetical protein [Nonlabens ulvanivorans]|uniref:hypothetical protein n=1 Tax=Nonlabens ulvanivorans TaxID=906888 RepID=UPI0037C6925A
MFNFLKNKNKITWQLETIKKIINKLGEDYFVFIDHINSGLYTGIRKRNTDIKYYYGFTYDKDLFRKYLDESKQSYTLKGIQVFDILTSKYVDLSIYITGGIIIGYSVNTSKNIKIDNNQIKLNNFSKQYLQNLDYENISNLLNNREKEIIDSSIIQRIVINDNEYFKIKDLEDGNFIGIDNDKNVYRITHDPLVATLLNETIYELLIEDKGNGSE